MDKCGYDFGDDWIFTFTITVSKISEAEKRFEPRIVKFKGYIQQYPDLDKEDWDYEQNKMQMLRELIFLEVKDEMKRYDMKERKFN